MGISEFDDAYEDEQEIRGAILTEPVRALDPREPACIQPDQSIGEAINAMNSLGAGCVLVTENDQLIGIFTERDVLRNAGKIDLSKPVRDCMTESPETVGLDDGIAYVLNKMHVGGYRHVPILDVDGKPVGIISVKDIVRFIVSLFPGAVLNLPPEPELGIARSPGGA